MKTVFLIALSLISFSAHAQRIQSLETAIQIPEVDTVNETLTITENSCPPGKNFNRLLHIRFKGSSETFSYTIQTKFVAAEWPIPETCDRNDQACLQRNQTVQQRQQQIQQQQCQLQQGTPYSTNKGTFLLDYVANLNTLLSLAPANSDFKSVLKFQFNTGPFLLLSGGTAWSHFEKLPYKNTVQNTVQDHTETTVQFAAGTNELCMEIHLLSGSEESDNAWCALQLEKAKP
jgi:hypothetical protein